MPYFVIRSGEDGTSVEEMTKEELQEYVEYDELTPDRFLDLTSRL